MRRTYVDAGVLMTAARGNAELSGGAIEVLCDTTREFVSSSVVRLEVLPGAQSASETEFYEAYFRQVSIWATLDSHLVATAVEEARCSGVTPLEAVHLVLAASTGCDELVTADEDGSAIFGSQRILVVGIAA